MVTSLGSNAVVVTRVHCIRVFFVFFSVKALRGLFLLSELMSQSFDFYILLLKCSLSLLLFCILLEENKIGLKKKVF